MVFIEEPSLREQNAALKRLLHEAVIELDFVQKTNPNSSIGSILERAVVALGVRDLREELQP